jgi:hypothetical protein
MKFGVDIPAVGSLIQKLVLFFLILPRLPITTGQNSFFFTPYCDLFGGKRGDGDGENDI